MLLFSLQVSSAFRLAKFQNSQSVQSLSHLFSLKAHSETLKKMKTVFHAVHSACFRLELPCLQCIQGTTSRASMWFNCPSSICSKRSLPTGVTPRTQLDKQIRRQQCKQWQPWDFEARCNFLLYSYNPGAIAHSAFNFFHDNKVPFRRLQNLTILKRKNSKISRTRN